MNIPARKVILPAVVLCGIGIVVFYVHRQAEIVREPEFADVCINDLRMIDAAKGEWALAHQAKAGDIVVEKDLLPFVRDKRMLACPLGGTYHIGKIGETPTCSLGTNITPAHVLP